MASGWNVQQCCSSSMFVVLVFCTLFIGVSPDKQPACERGLCVCNTNDIRCVNSNTGGIFEVPSNLEPKTIIGLTIVRTSLQRIEEKDFAGLEHLKTLFLQDNDINYIHPRAFRNMYRLEILNLEANALTTLDSTGLVFQHLPSLELLNVINNAITEMNRYTFLTSVTTPKRLDVKFYNNPINCDCDVLAIKNWERSISNMNRIALAQLSCANDDPWKQTYDVVPTNVFGQCSGDQANIFSTMFNCPICDKLRTNHECNLQPKVTCGGVQMVCLKGVKWNESRHKMEITSRCESYLTCLNNEGRNKEACGVDYTRNGDITCEFCCMGPTCENDTIGGRTYDLTFYMSYTRNQGSYQPWMVHPSDSRYKTQTKAITTGVRGDIRSIKGGVDVYIHSFDSFSATQHNVTLRLEFTVITSQSEGQVRDMLESDLGTSVLNATGYLFKDKVIPTSILLTRNKATSSPDLLYCREETTISSKGEFKWPQTKADIRWSLPCPYKKINDNIYQPKFAMRQCFLGTSNSGVVANWGPVQDGDCDVKPTLDDIEQTDIKPDNAAEISLELEQITETTSSSPEDKPSDSPEWTPKDVDRVVSVLEKLVKPENLAEKGVPNSVVKSLSNLLDVDPDVMRSAQNDEDTSQRMVHLIDAVSENTPLTNGKLKVVSPNIAVVAQGITSAETKELTLVANIDSDTDDDLDSSKVEVEPTTKGRETPQNSNNLVLPVPAILESLTDQQKQSLSRACFTVHRSDKLFATMLPAEPKLAVSNSEQIINSRISDKTTTTTDSGQNKPDDNANDDKNNNPDDIEASNTPIGTYYVQINSLVLSARVPGVKVENLKENVTMTFQHSSQNATNPQCVFWDEIINDWSSRGCGVVMSSPGVTQCGCDHLTNFALLMDVYQEGTGLSSLDRKILSYISYIGCGISLAALILTLLTYALFRKLRRDNPSKILINLCLALLCSNLVYLVGMHDYSFDNSNICKVVAVLLHYFLLSSLCWMAVEAFYMYLALILVFKTYFTNFIVKCSLVGWGVPLAIVVVTLMIDSTSNYGFINTGMCWLRNPAFYAAFVGPVCLILLVNCIAFALVIRQLTNMSSSKLNKSDKSNTVQRLRGAIGVVILLGLTWIFAVFAIGEASKVFYYLFAIFNSLQGLFIFIFYCLLKKDAMTAWKRILPCFDQYGERSKDSSNSRDSHDHSQVALLRCGASQSVSTGTAARYKINTSTNNLKATSSGGTVSTTASDTSRKSSTVTMVDNGHYSTIEDKDMYANHYALTAGDTTGSNSLAVPPNYSVANAVPLEKQNGVDQSFYNPAFQPNTAEYNESIYHDSQESPSPPPSSPPPTTNHSPYPAATNAQSFYAPPLSFHQRNFQQPQHWHIQSQTKRGGATGEVDASNISRVNDIRLRFEPPGKESTENI